MDEKTLMDQIRYEIDSLSGNQFEKISRLADDADYPDRAEVIDTSAVKRSVFVRYGWAAAAVLIPVTAALMLFNGHDENRYTTDTDNNSIAVSFTTVSAMVSQSTASQTAFSEKLTVPETQPVTSAVTETSVISSAETSETTVLLTVPESKAESLKHTEGTTTVTVSQTTPPVTVPETAAVTEEKEPETTTSNMTDTNNDPELFEIPGEREKLFSLEFNGSETGTEKIFEDLSGEYRIISPESYTVYIFDIMIYKYDYYDFIHNGDYVLKDEHIYTLEEILESENRIINIEDLIKAGLKAEKL